MGACRSFIISAVNPKFIYYSRPVLLSLTVGPCLTAILAFLLFQNLQAETCIRQGVQYMGSILDHQAFIDEALDSATGNTQVTICLANIKGLVVSSQELGGRIQIAQEPCHPEQTEPNLMERVEWCEGSDRPDRVYNNPTDPMLCRVRNVRDTIPLPYMADYRQTTCTRPEFVTALGATLGYSTQIELALTIVFIAIFMGCGCIHTVGGGKRFVAVDGEENDVKVLHAKLAKLETKLDNRAKP